MSASSPASTRNGNPIIISGNHNKRVGEAVYARSRVIAYVMPTERAAVPATGRRARAGEPSVVRAGGFESPITELLAAIEAEQDAAPSSQRSPQARKRSAQAQRRMQANAPRRRCVPHRARSADCRAGGQPAPAPRT